MFEFPLKAININFPSWVACLDDDEELKVSLLNSVRQSPLPQGKIRNVSEYIASLSSNEYAKECSSSSADLGSGTATVEIHVDRSHFYEILSKHSQLSIKDDGALMRTVIDLCHLRRRYEQYSQALEQAQSCGYGVVMPTREELILEEPELIKQEGRYGVRLRACAPSLHMIKAEIQTQITPLIGTENQSEEFASQLLEQFKNSPNSVWDTDIFGRSLYDLVNDGLRSKLYNMPDEARNKYKETLERIINEGSDGLICIIL